MHHVCYYNIAWVRTKDAKNHAFLESYLEVEVEKRGEGSWSGGSERATTTS